MRCCLSTAQTFPPRGGDRKHSPLCWNHDTSYLQTASTASAGRQWKPAYFVSPISRVPSRQGCPLPRFAFCTCMNIISIQFIAIYFVLVSFNGTCDNRLFIWYPWTTISYSSNSSIRSRLWYHHSRRIWYRSLIMIIIQYPSHRTMILYILVWHHRDVLSKLAMT